MTINDELQAVTVTRNERIQAYQRCPALLVEELEFVFIDAIRPEHCAVHRQSLDKLKQLCPDRNAMLKAVSRAVINAAIHSERKSENG